MKTLEQHNKERWDEITLLQRANAAAYEQPNGVSCPKCQSELIDSMPNVILTSNPPKKNVHCPKCGYVGYRLA